MMVTFHDSPYLASGIISARQILREIIRVFGKKNGELDASRDTGIGRYVQEIGKSIFRQVRGGSDSDTIPGSLA